MFDSKFSVRMFSCSVFVGFQTDHISEIFLGKTPF